MKNKEKRKRIWIFIFFIIITLFIWYIGISITEQKNEFKQKNDEILRLEKEIKQVEKENSLLKDPEYIKNEFRKKYNLIEGNEKIINFPQNNE